jgi:hypothetical protein
MHAAFHHRWFLLLDFGRMNTRRIEVRHNRDVELPLAIWAQPMIAPHLRMCCADFLAYVQPSRPNRAVPDNIELSATHPSVFNDTTPIFLRKIEGQPLGSIVCGKRIKQFAFALARENSWIRGATQREFFDALTVMAGGSPCFSTAM